MIDAIVIRNANYFQYNFATIRMGGTVGYAVIVLLVGVYLRKNPSAQFFWQVLVSDSSTAPD